MSPVEVAWTAGVVEGEGSIRKGGKLRGRLCIAITNHDIIERLHRTTGIGIMHDQGRQREHYKQVWDWTVTRRENMCAIATAVAPLLLRRRREQISSISDAAGLSMPDAASLNPGEPAAWGWVAGLIEGEGWISPAPGSTRRSFGVAVESTDLDVIERLAQLTGAGYTFAIKRVRPGERPRWSWKVSSRAETVRVLTAIRPCSASVG